MASEKTLAAAYSSPSNEGFTVTKTLQSPSSTSPSDRSKYLESLRQAVTETQEQVNKELTARMEEDKSREAASGQATDAAAKLGADEDQEEENYGEEVQEEED